MLRGSEQCFIRCIADTVRIRFPLSGDTPDSFFIGTHLLLEHIVLYLGDMIYKVLE
jgi:hypothetical protein